LEIKFCSGELQKKIASHLSLQCVQVMGVLDSITRIAKIQALISFQRHIQREILTRSGKHVE